LEAALDGLTTDTKMQEMLGEEFCNLFTKVKQFELARFHNQITEWERNEYMDVY
jgi:glutamine synthetase